MLRVAMGALAWSCGEISGMSSAASPAVLRVPRGRRAQLAVLATRPRVRLRARRRRACTDTSSAASHASSICGTQSADVRDDVWDARTLTLLLPAFLAMEAALALGRHAGRLAPRQARGLALAHLEPTSGCGSGGRSCRVPAPLATGDWPDGWPVLGLMPATYRFPTRCGRLTRCWLPIGSSCGCSCAEHRWLVARGSILASADLSLRELRPRSWWVALVASCCDRGGGSRRAHAQSARSPRLTSRATSITDAGLTARSSQVGDR